MGRLPGRTMRRAAFDAQFCQTAAKAAKGRAAAVWRGMCRGGRPEGPVRVLSTLFAGDFDRYFAEAGRDASLWVFVHVPKTAGSSLEVDLATFMKPFANIHIDYTDTSKPYQKLLDETVERFLTRHRETPYRLAAGHIMARHTELLRQTIPGVRGFSMLRNPIDRLISDYRYQCSRQNVAREAFVSTTPDFATYVGRKHVHNKAALALVPRPIVEAGDVAAATDHVMRNYAFVGLQEQYPLSLWTLTALLGHPMRPKTRARVNTETEHHVVLTPQEEAEVRRLNAVDVGLFLAVSAGWRPIRDNLRHYLARHAHPHA